MEDDEDAEQEPSKGLLLLRATVHECDRLLRTNVTCCTQSPDFFWVYAAALCHLAQEEGGPDAIGYITMAKDLVDRGLDIDSNNSRLQATRARVLVDQLYFNILLTAFTQFDDEESDDGQARTDNDNDDIKAQQEQAKELIHDLKKEDQDKVWEDVMQIMKGCTDSVELLSFAWLVYGYSEEMPMEYTLDWSLYALTIFQEAVSRDDLSDEDRISCLKGMGSCEMTMASEMLESTYGEEDEEDYEDLEDIEEEDLVAEVDKDWPAVNVAITAHLEEGNIIIEPHFILILK